MGSKERARRRGGGGRGGCQMPAKATGLRPTFTPRRDPPHRREGRELRAHAGAVGRVGAGHPHRRGLPRAQLDEAVADGAAARPPGQDPDARARRPVGADRQVRPLLPDRLATHFHQRGGAHHGAALVLRHGRGVLLRGAGRDPELDEGAGAERRRHAALLRLPDRRGARPLHAVP